MDGPRSLTGAGSPLSARTPSCIRHRHGAKIELVVNVATARMLGLPIPQSVFLQAADVLQ